MNPMASLLLSNVLFAGALALLALGLTRIWRSPHLAHALALLVLLKLVTPPLVHLPWPFQQGQAESNGPVEEEISPVRIATEEITENESPSLTSSSPSHEVLSPPTWRFARPSWSSVLITFWASGFVLVIAGAARRHQRLQQIVEGSRKAEPDVQERTRSLSAQLGLRGCPEVLISDQRLSPLVSAGFKRSVILLPESLLTTFDSGQLTTVLAHELAHIRRRDHWVRRFEWLVMSIHWWNPVAWWASRRLHQAEEECCDALVIWALPDQRRSYGAALLKTVEFLTEEKTAIPATGHAFGSFPFTKRIENIMKKQTNHSMSGAARSIVLLLGIAVLPFASTAISQPQQPQLQQQFLENRAPAPPSDPATTPETATAPVPPRDHSWEIYEFSVHGEKSHAQAMALRQLIKETPDASLAELAPLAKKKGTGLENVHFVRSLDQIKQAKVREAATVLGEGQVSNVIRIDGKSIVVRCVNRAPSQTPPKNAIQIAEEEARKTRQRLFVAKRRVLRLDHESAVVRFMAAKEKLKAITELGDQNLASRDKIREAQLASDLARINMERTEAEIEVFEAEHSLGEVASDKRF